MQITDHIHALKIPFAINDPAGRKVPRFVYSYLKRIHGCVLKQAEANPKLSAMQLCRLVLIELGLPEVMANPLVAASFQSSLKQG